MHGLRLHVIMYLSEPLSLTILTNQTDGHAMRSPGRSVSAGRKDGRKE